MVSDFLSRISFGKLDPSNFGIWLNFEVFMQYDLVNRQKNRAIPQLTPLVFSSIYDGITNEHREFIGLLSNKDERQFALCAMTLYAHETRHYHDLMSTPYGARIMCNYMQLNYTTALCRREVMHNSKHCVLPLSDWVHDSDIFESVYDIPSPQKYLKFLQGSIDNINGDHAEQRDGIVDWAALGYPHADSFDSDSILESMAVLHQGLLIAKEFGDASYREFIEIFENKEYNKRFLGAIGVVNGIFRRQLPPFVVTNLLHASLFRYSYDEDRPKLLPPKDALIELCYWVRDKQIPIERICQENKAVQFYQEYFQAVTGQGLDEAIFATDELNQRYYRDLNDHLNWYKEKNPRTETKGASLCLELFDQLITVHKGFSATVSFNLDAYHGLKYIQDQRNLTTPITFIEINGLPLTKLNDDPLEEYFVIAEEIRVAPGKNLRLEDQDFMSSVKLTDEGVIRLAFLLSLKDFHQEHPPIPKFFKHRFKHPREYFELAQRNYDGNGTWLLAFMYGKKGVPEIVWETFKAVAVNLCGVNIFTSDGPELPSAHTGLERFGDKGILKETEKSLYSDEMVNFFRKIRDSKQ